MSLTKDNSRLSQEIDQLINEHLLKTSSIDDKSATGAASASRSSQDLPPNEQQLNLQQSRSMLKRDSQLLQQQKQLMREQNLRLYLEHMDMIEQQRMEQQNFQNCNQDLHIVKSVRMYKQIKSEVYNWHQIVRIVSDLVFLLALLIAAFEALALAVKGHPFLLGLCVTYQGSKYLHPSVSLGKLPYHEFVSGLTLTIAAIGFAFWFFSRRLVEKRNVRLSYKMEKVMIFSMIFIVAVVALLYYFGRLYLDGIDQVLT